MKKLSNRSSSNNNSPEKAISQLIIAGFNEMTPPEKWLKMAQENPLGGVILFKRNVENLPQLLRLNTRLQELPSAPLICVDEEGGRVSRLSGLFNPLPSMRALSSTLNPEEKIKESANYLGRSLKQMGFNLNFAPVCDLDINDKNQVIGDRSFGFDPKKVSRLTSIFIETLQSHGVAACAKHFPGHGDTHIDSHEALPIIETPLQTILKRDLPPFVEAVKKGVATVMTAHTLVKAIDQTYPATMSKDVLKLLREYAKFKKVIISDDLLMNAVSKNYKLKDILRYSLLAGVNMFIISNDLQVIKEAICYLHEFFTEDFTLKKQIINSIEKVQALKSAYPYTPLSVMASSR